MRLFIDTANLDEIREIHAWGVLAGVTTNPSLVAKEGADGLLGMAIVHPDYPDGLGVVVKIAHGWNAQATWYIARGILGVLGIELRNPYPLHRQKAFLVPGVVPPERLSALEALPTWDEWDPDRDRWYADLHRMEAHASRPGGT